MSNKFLFTTQLRDVNDLNLQYPFLKMIPKFIKYLLLKIYPVKYKLIPLIKNNKITGYLLVFLYTSKEVLRNKEHFSKIFLKHLKKIKSKIDYSIVGLGSFTSVVSRGGLDYINSIDGVCFTNGNALTTYVSFNHIIKLLNRLKDNPKVAIIGANGSIGSALTRLLSKNMKFSNINKILCVIKKNRNILDLYNLENIIITSDINKISDCNVIIMCTSSRDVLLDKVNFKKETIIYDITQPSNISDVVRNNSNIKIITGGLLELKNNLTLNCNIGYGRNVVYSCLGETILLSEFNYKQDFSLGHVQLKNIDIIGNMIKKSSLLKL